MVPFYYRVTTNAQTLEKALFSNLNLTKSLNLPRGISAQNEELNIYQILDKHRNLSVQFAYLLIIQEIWAN